MCEPCTLHGTEDRCLTCRPRRTREEKDERRANALRRSEWMHCEACGYRGPRFEKVGSPEKGDLLPLFLAPLFLNVVGLIVAVVLAVRGFTTITCPRCETRDSLWPAQKTGDAPPEAWVQAERLQRSEWFARRRAGVVLAVLVGTLLTALGVVRLLDLLGR